MKYYLKGLLVMFLINIVHAEALTNDIIPFTEYTDNLSKVNLRSIFFMNQRTWSDGTRISVYVLPTNDPMHEKFCKEVLVTPCSLLEMAWERRVFTGTGNKPIVVQNVTEMREKLCTIKGSIGYVPNHTVKQCK